MNNTAHRLGWLALALVALSAAACQDIICLADPDEEHLCEPRQDIVGEELRVEGPVATTVGVAYSVPAANRVTLLRTDDGDATVDHIDVPERPTLMRTSPDRKRLLVLSPIAQTLVSINVEDTSDRQTYHLRSPFQSMALSDDGRFAIVFAVGEGDGSVIVQNNSQMGVIDLDQDPGEDNPQLVALRSRGSQPYAVNFAPPFTIDGETRRFALILSNNYVTLLELTGFNPEDPNANETVVSFVQDGDNRSLRTQEVLWTEDDPERDDDFFAFLRTSGSDDIISLNLLPGDRFDEFNQRPFVRPSLNQLTGGRTPVSINLFETRDGRKKLLSVNQGSRDLAIVDVATSDTTLIPLEEPVDRSMVFTAINKDTDRQEPFALLYSANQSLRTVLFVELETAEVRRTRAISRLNLNRGIASLTMTPDPTRALILHQNLNAFSILNLERQFVTPLDLTSTVSAFDFVSEVGEERLLTILTGEPFVASVELRNGQPSTVRLDLPAEQMAIVPETNSLVIDHGEQLGGVTILPLDTPNRDDARVLWGFGVDSLLDVRD